MTQVNTRSPWPVGDGEMARRVREYDWAATPLGPSAAWPEALRAAVEAVIASPAAVPGKDHASSPLTTDAVNAFLVRFSDAVLGVSDPAKIAQLACQLVAETLEVERAYWAEVDWSSREYVIGAAVHQPGVLVIDGRFPVDAWEPFTSYHLSGSSVVVDDTQADERVPPEMRAAYAQIAVGADLATPIVVNGQLRCILAVNQQRPRRWTEAEVALVRGIAGRCWAAVDRARAETALRASETRQRFLLAVGDAMRAETSASGKIAIAARHVGEHLAASRVLYAEFDDERGVADIFNGWFADGAQPFPAVMRLTEYEGPVLDDLQAGRTVRIDDIASRAGHPHFAALAAVGVQALLSVPLVVGSTLTVNLSVHQQTARQWSDDDVALVEELADRLWAEIVRARAEAALRESEMHFRSFAENSTDTLWIVDVEHGHLEYLSPAFERMWGEPREAVMDDLDRWRDLVHPEDRALASEAMRRVVTGEVSPLVNEYRIIRPADGAVRWIFDTGFAIHDTAGPVTRVGGIAQDITARKLAEDALRESEARHREALEAEVAAATAKLRTLSRRLLLVQEEERRKLALELHDEIGQVLTGLGFQIASATRTGGTAALAEAAATVSALTEQVRQLSLDLRPQVLDRFGLLAAIEWYVERYQATTGITVHLRHDGMARRFPPEGEIAAYRVVQEALTNIARHAHTGEAWVTLVRNGTLLLVVQDDGRGFDPAQIGESSGLGGMRERVTLLGGTFQVETAPGEGTHLTALFPLDDQDQAPFAEDSP
ncbi:MAG: PAS domain S-box protein [Thermomicrobiales bacterium]